MADVFQFGTGWRLEDAGGGLITVVEPGGKTQSIPLDQLRGFVDKFRMPDEPLRVQRPSPPAAPGTNPAPFVEQRILETRDGRGEVREVVRK